MKTNLILFILCIFNLSAIAQPVEGKLLGRWEDPTIVGSSLYDNKYNEVWGIARGGKEYAIIGSSQGTHFIDITDPTQPKEAFFIEGNSHGSHIVHRDFHDYGCYLYAVAGEGNISTLQIIDLSELPDKLTVAYDSRELFSKTHNMFIDSSSAKLYTFAESAKNRYSAMSIYDISNPIEPTYITSYNTFAGIKASHVHDGFIQNDIAYLNLGNDGLAIIDYSDPLNPIPLGTLTTYDDQGYNHSGWATPDNQYYYMADENWGFKMKAIDISDLSDLKVEKLFGADAASPKSIAHNQILACDYLYVAYYFDGLQVYDVSDRSNPKRIMYYDTYPGETIKNYKGAWGVFPFLPSGNILLSDMQTGLYVIQGFQDNCNTKQITSCPTILANNDLNSNIINFDIAPNPVSNIININLILDSYDTNQIEIELVDINSHVVLKKNVPVNLNNKWKLDVQFLESGFYILNIKTEKILLSKKVIVTH